MTPSLFRRQARQENLTPRMGSAALERQQPKSASFYRRKLAA
jgi:hypothetical protein